MGLDTMDQKLDKMFNKLPDNLNGCGEPFPEGRRNYNEVCSLNCTRNYSHPSTSSTMSENSTPTCVYKRRRQSKKSVAIFAVQPCNVSKPCDGCHSAISSEAASLAGQELMVSVSERSEAVRSPIMGPVECNTVAIASLSGCHACGANDNCSSSKSNLELSSASLKVDMDDAGECSSSDALIGDKASEEISEWDICISILRSQGLLDKVWTRQDEASNENTGVTSDHYCLKTCKVCERMESTLRMLICDNCEEAFHISCYNPCVKILPAGEWLCSSCLKKKHKILKDRSTSNSVNVSTEIGRKYSPSEGQLGSLEFMLRDTEPYMSNVRIGDDFQANVPNWRGPIDEECDYVGDLLEMDPPNIIKLEKKDSTKQLKLSSIGNWLQCQAVIEGIGEDVDGAICGKWRRAPLFEVQTDDWECFCCVLWDPAHADCAIPQEIDTEEIMKQLKYIELLRPRLAGKRRKMECSRSMGSQD